MAAAAVALLVPLTVGSQFAMGESGLPHGDLQGWHQEVAEDFNTPVALGSYTSSALADDFFPYNGSPDTFRTGLYDPDKVLSVKDGKLDWYLHSEGDLRRVGAVVVTMPASGWGQTYGRYSVRYRTDVVPGYKMAFLLWPDSDNWGEGEIDFPESHSLEEDSLVYGNLFRRGDTTSRKPGTSSISDSGVPAAGSGWHIATIEWQPDSVTFIMDGVTLGTKAVGVPNTPMHWVLQVETSHEAASLSDRTSGHVQVDWVTAYSRR